MKVLHLISGGDTGGAKTHVFALMDALVKKIDVKLVCFMKGVFYDELKKMPVDSELIEQKSRTDMSVLTRLCEIIDEGYDIIHCHGARANFIACELKRRGVKLPFVTTIHSDYLLDFDGFYRKLVYTSLNVMALNKFDYYIAVSSNFKSMLISRGFRPNSIYTVYNGMDYSSPMTYVSKEEFAARIGIEYDPKLTYVGLIGRHDRVKGHDVFINAAKLVLDRRHDIRFVIAGEGDGREELVSLCQKHGISDKVIFCGFVKDIYSFINFIDINTLTSRCESFPYVLMEGARMKKPTVCSRVGGIPDLILDGECGLLFDNENFEELSEKLLYLIENPQIATAFGNALYEHATANFSNESLASSHVNIYESILRDRASDKKYDVTLSGYYGFNNCGDDALLYAIIRDLKNKNDNIRINVLSARPKNTKLAYQVDSQFRFDFFALKRLLQNTKMLINGGGSLIQDATSSKSLWYYLYVMKLAKKCGCKLFVYANGIGPIKDKNLLHASKVLRQSDYITLREPASLAVLERLNVTSVPTELTADPAVSLCGARKSRIDLILRDCVGDTNKRLIGVSVRDWDKNDPQFAKKMASVLDAITEKYDVHVLFIPMKYPDDLKPSQRIAAIMRNRSYILTHQYSFDEIIGIISRTDLVIAMRLHSLIFSVSAGIPAVGIIYDPKINGFLDYAGIKHMVDSSDIDTDILLGSVDEIFSDYENTRAAVGKIRQDLSSKAMKNADIAINILEESN